MKRTLALSLAVALCPLAAVAAPRPPPPGADRAGTADRPAPPGGAGGQDDRRGRRAQMREDVQRRLRLYRTVELSQALELSDAEALKLSAEMQRFDDRREAPRAELHETRRLARKAAKGEAAALAGLDKAIVGSTGARKALADIDLEEYQALVKLVPAQKRGKLALFLVQYPQRVQKLVRQSRGDGPDEE